MSVKPELKPDWENAPDWAEWLAQGVDGVWCWHEKKPETDVYINVGYDIGYWTSDGKMCIAGNNPLINRNWRDTLERRPRKVSVELDLGDVLERVEKLCKHINELNVTGPGFATTVTTTVPIDTIQMWSDGKVVCEITNIEDKK